MLDGERRCWSCGSKDHLATACNRTDDPKPKASKVAARPEKEARSEKVEEAPEKAEGESEDSRQNLLDEANKMLKTLQESDVREKRQVKENSELRLQGLQKQLDELKKASLDPTLSDFNHLPCWPWRSFRLRSHTSLATTM